MNKDTKDFRIEELIERIDITPSNSDSPVSDEEIISLIKAARLAPSADNSQIFKFLVIKDINKISRISDFFSKRDIKYKTVIVALAAPFIIKHIRREQPFYAIDVPISISHILIKGVEEGIKVDIEFIFENEEIKRILNIPSKYKTVALLGLSRYEDK